MIADGFLWVLNWTPSLRRALRAQRNAHQHVRRTVIGVPVRQRGKHHDRRRKFVEFATQDCDHVSVGTHQ